MYDILIVGGGPAGLSAAVAAQSRGKRCLVLSNPWERNPLSKAPQIHNYLGMCGIPFDASCTYPENAQTVFLAESAGDDPDLVQ